MTSMLDMGDRPYSDSYPGPSVSPSLSGKVNILLVDDDPRNLDVLESILDTPEYRLVRARSADDALRLIMSENFALLVLDVRMPDMNGLELAQLIKQRKKTQHLPIIFLTAYYREDEHVLQGYGAGGVDYLSKPCNPAVLRSKVSVFVELFRANRALQDEIAERRQAEERLVERTAEVHRLVGQLRALASELTTAEQKERKRLAKILHDYIQQLLVSALMQLGSVRRDPNSERAFEVLQGIETILKDALAASRSLTVELSPPILHESGLAAGLKWLADRMWEKNQFKVHVHTDGPAEPATEEQRFLLFECTRELLFNAMKHAGVHEAEVSVFHGDDKRVKVKVEDHGKGFDFDQVRDRNGDQVTFGLFSIQQRLTHLGGMMEVETEPERGVCVTLTSPPGQCDVVVEEIEATAPATEAEVRVKPAGPDLPVIRVLIVDDHKIVRQGLVRLLQFQPDIEIVGEAGNGAQAIELADILNPDVTIMDLNLGDMSGLHVTQVILARNPAIKVIVLSMYLENEMGAAALNAGAVAYLSKGVASDDLITAIRSCSPRGPITPEVHTE
jgi:DNA-binding NarL/FixJ family response regulator